MMTPSAVIETANSGTFQAKINANDNPILSR